MHNHSHENETEVDHLHAGHDRSPEAKAALDTMREKLTGKQGRLLWKSYEELADTPEFQVWLEDEFPNRSTLLSMDRRKFLTLGGAAMAMAGLSGCRILPQMHAVPYVRAPEEMIAGKPLTYATAIAARGGYATGILVESYDGRPIKVEGNPAHPASLGATLVHEQAEVLNMYDPDRSQSIIYNSEAASWDQFYGVARKALIDRAVNGGAGIALLTETITSPTLTAQINEFLRRFPQARWHQYEPISRDNVYEGTKLAFGRPLNPVYKLRGAKVVVSLDGNFLTDMPGSIRYARDFSEGRRVRKNRPEMNRLYTVESAYTLTGAKADHRLGVKPSEVEQFARALYAGVSGGAGENAPAGVPASWLAALVKDLQANRGAAVVIPGEHTTPATQALAHAINSALGAVGATVVYTEPVEAHVENQTASLKALVDDMNAGKVQALLILGANPVYTAPADYKFLEAMTSKNGDRDNVPLRIRLGHYVDETSVYCHWHLPETHPFEAWSDLRAYDGTASVVQPLIAPLYEGRSAHELLAGLIGQPKSGYEIVRDYWAGASGVAGVAFEGWWESTLNNGIVPNSAAAPVPVAARGGIDAALPAAPTGGALELSFRPDPSLWDGRYSNNSWLQELPKPITTITWDNVAILSPATAKQLNIIPAEAENDATNIAQVTGKMVVEVAANGGKVSLPVWILPGQPDGVVTIHLGFGRKSAGNVGNDQGFDVYPLRTSQSMDFAVAQVTLTNKSYQISSTQPFHSLRGIREEKDRDIIRVATLEEFAAKHGEVWEQEHVAHLPEATGFAAEAHGEKHEEHHRIEGSGGGIPNDVGHNISGDQPAVVADAFRKQWEYTDRSTSNREGWPSMYPEYSTKGFNAWAMSIDLTTCIGCNACTIACQSENNIPTVGKEMIGRGREMHWLRIDHYYSSEPDLSKVESHFQPLACVHCEKAPCEPVCPVAATIHNHEGLNQMIYNRCIGTRYCSNNCPYKVRRFNYLKWTAGVGGKDTLNFDLPVLKMLANPDVTVRGRGVMEKCTYCVQRINAKRIEVKKEGRDIRDGEVITACQQVCPTRAIVFGDINNPKSEVVQLRKEPATYYLLADLNTRPRTTYMAQIKNPNPEITPAGGKPGDERNS